MPLSRDILQAHRTGNVFIETGTLAGEAAMWALSLGMQVHTIELDPQRAQWLRNLWYARYQVHQYEGDSADVLPDLLEGIYEPCTFWLDAHPAGTLTLNNTPVLSELKAIRAWMDRTRLLPTIMSDDMRLYCESERQMLGETFVELFPELRISKIDSPVAKYDIIIGET